MRLSEAILLGDSLKKPDGWKFNAKWTGCGCAIAGARRAAGIEDNEACPLDSHEFRKAWPWVTDSLLIEISTFYFDVTDGRKTIEQLADWVRSIEPADSPESVTNPQETSTEKVTL